MNSALATQRRDPALSISAQCQKKYDRARHRDQDRQTMRFRTRRLCLIGKTSAYFRMITTGGINAQDQSDQ